MHKRLIIHVFGQVQGVWFRKSTEEKANDFGLVGFCKNLENGAVYIEVEGDMEYLKYFTDWCKIGPDLAKVNEIKITEEALVGYQGFEIK